MLEADSIKNPMIEDTKKKPQSKAKTGVRQLQNSPITLQARKVKMPKETSFYRPGVVLPVCKTRLISDEPNHIVVLSADSLRGFNGRLRPKERVLFII
jgi:hypothetical protein